MRQRKVDAKQQEKITQAVQEEEDKINKILAHRHKTSYFVGLCIIGLLGLILSVYLVKDKYFPSKNSAFCEINASISCSKVQKSAYSKMFNVPLAIFGCLWNFVLLLSAALAWVIEREGTVNLLAIQKHMKDTYLNATVIEDDKSKNLKTKEHEKTKVDSDSNDDNNSSKTNNADNGDDNGDDNDDDDDLESSDDFFAPQTSINYLVNGIFLWNIIGSAFVFYLIYAEIIVGALCPFCTIIHLLTFIALYLSFKMYQHQLCKPSVYNIVWNVKLLIVLIAILHIIPVVLFNSQLIHNLSGVNTAPGIPATEKFAKCLTENGWIFYGTSTCGWCKRQKQLFADHFQHIKFVDCKEVDCKHHDIKGYPTWIQFDVNDSSNDNDDTANEIQRVSGFKRIEDLTVISSCSL